MKAVPMRWRTLLIGLCLGLAVVAARAGRGCEPRLPDAQAVQKAMDLARRTAQALDASSAQVVVLARVGQDLSRYGLTWSHFGLAYRDGSQWRVLHKLNQCGTAHADVYRQGLGEFFLDDMFRFQSAFKVFTPPWQERLKPLLQDNRRVLRLHEPSYSMVAYPWSTRYQQSNQWALETLALAQDGRTSSREQAQAWLRWQGYEATTLHLSAMSRLGARLTSAHIAFDDHPDGKRFSGRIETVTVDSVFDWMDRQAMAGPLQLVP
jgi:hypothetical protein